MGSLLEKTILAKRGVRRNEKKMHISGFEQFKGYKKIDGFLST